MRKYDLLIGLALLLATPLCAQGWLPKQPTVNLPCRLLECTYDKAQLKHCEDASTDWQVELESLCLSTKTVGAVITM